MIWLPIPFAGTHLALWGYQFYFLFSPNKSNSLVFLTQSCHPTWTFYFTFPRNSWDHWYVHSKEHSEHQVEAECIKFSIPFGIPFRLPFFSKGHTWHIVYISWVFFPGFTHEFMLLFSRKFCFTSMSQDNYYYFVFIHFIPLQRMKCSSRGF